MLKTKIKRLFSWPKLLAGFALLLLVALSLGRPLTAQTAFTQGYGADQVLQKGMIVQIAKEDASKVEPVTFETMEQMHGVVVDANDAPGTISNEGEKVFVATAGRYEVLVSTQNGAVSRGDYLTISALNGIGMKSGTKEPIVIGRALADFDAQAAAATTAEVNDSGGGQKKVSIGRVMADIMVARNPHLTASEPNVPEFLRRATEAIAGKSVSPLRAYVSVVVFVLSTIIAAILMYGGIRSAIISVGRNPLSKKSIIRGMLQVILTGLIIFITGLFGVYLILKL